MMTYAALAPTFELQLQAYERNRMYPRGYRKESPVTKLESFIEYLKQLASQAPSVVVKMPPNSVGLPEGTFCLEALLIYIAKCLDDELS